MYKLLIVEDEPLIRMGLQHYFSWEELGVSTICEAENGQEGLYTALREQPDLIITDIRMPELDGLQMIEQLRATLPDTLFIILTGFNDFEYAQRAIRLGGVHAFLLKPLEYEESFATIQSCLKTLTQRRNEREFRDHLEQQVMESSIHKGDQLVNFVLEDELAAWEDGIGPYLHIFGNTPLMYQPFVVTWLPQATLLPSRKVFRQLAEALIETTLQAMYVHTSPKQLFLYIDKMKCYAIAVLAEQVSNASIEHLSPLLDDSSLFIAVGRSMNDSEGLSRQLHQTDKALYQRFYQTQRQLFFPLQAEETPVRAKETHLLLNEADKQLIIAGMESGNTASIEQLMHRLAQDLSTHLPHSSMDRGFAYIQEIVSVTIRFAHQHGIPVEGVYSDKLLKLTCVDDFPTLAALFNWLAAWLIQVSSVYQDEFTSLPTNQQDVLIFEQIEAFLKEHIDQDITLQMVADRFYYNPSYLSRIFKRRLDKNYMRFVTEIRIQYAQECLKNPAYLVTDVCTMCGYKSYKHFVKTFRSITNMTPTDYRKKLGW